MNCTCIAKVNEGLKPVGMELAVSWVMDPLREVLTVTTRPIPLAPRQSKETWTTGVIASFCPFCGIRQVPVPDGPAHDEIPVERKAEMYDSIARGDRILLPVSKDHAGRMMLIAEHFMKTQVE